MVAIGGQESVHAVVSTHVIYVRRSYKEVTAADVSDEHQETACRRLLPPDEPIRVISDSGGHQSGFTADRDGFQQVLAALAAGEVRSLAVYDLSRLARNATLMLNLRNELERRGVRLLVANVPATQFDGAMGRYMYGVMCLSAQLQRDLDSERMVSMQRRLFEQGRHRGQDPLGYVSRRDAAGNLVHPRQLVIAPAEAAIVRRIWDELAVHSLAEVADLLNRDGVAPRTEWTREAVKDVYRRGRVYLGYVVEKRGREERPGQHEPILTVAQYERTIAAVAARRRTGNKPKRFRADPLRGLVFCSCGTRLRGEAHVQRGGERRYYRCPQLGCRARRAPADALEAEVLALIAEAALPKSVVDAAQRELRRRLQSPAAANGGRQRTRLTKRLEQLKKQHLWGDIEDAEYRAERDAVVAKLARSRMTLGSARSTRTVREFWRCRPPSPQRRRHAARSWAGSSSNRSSSRIGSCDRSRGRPRSDRS